LEVVLIDIGQILGPVSLEKEGMLDLLGHILMGEKKPWGQGGRAPGGIFFPI
jgi:hypothetical protein